MTPPTVTVERVATDSTWLSILVYAGAMTVSEIGSRQRIERQLRSTEWLRNSCREVEVLRSVIGKATAELNRRTVHNAPTNVQIKNMRMMKTRYGAESSAEITSLAEKLKERLKLLRSRIALRKADEERCRLRTMPTNLLLRSKGPSVGGETLDIADARKYWKGIVGNVKPFDHRNKDLVAWAEDLEGVKERVNLDDFLNHDLWKEVSRKAKPWKAHGPDRLQGFWWKAFRTANKELYQLARYHLETGKPLPNKSISGRRIILLYKAGTPHDPSNYRPIACLNTCYKLVTSFITTIVDLQVREHNILPQEQKALRTKVWGCTHALMLDQTIVSDSQDQKQRPISLAWIDYAKAFESVPHGYIEWSLKAVKIPTSVEKFVKSLLESWRVRNEAKDSRGRTLRSEPVRG